MYITAMLSNVLENFINHYCDKSFAEEKVVLQFYRR